jgi:hypothetical protein
VDLKPGSDEHVQIARQTVAEPARALPAAAKELLAARLPRADATWQASSFDLAQGLDVKVMESKLSRETLDQLFRA